MTGSGMGCGLSGQAVLPLRSSSLSQRGFTPCRGMGSNTRAIEKPRRALYTAFDREEPGFRCDAAIRRETADPAAGRDHPMARHDNRKRVSGERLPNGASRARGPSPRGEGAVCDRGAPRNATRGLVDAAVEWRHKVHVQPNG
jgi:hypothetical protein